MPALVTFIETKGTAIVRVGRIRGRAPAAPGRHVITAPAQLTRLEERRLDVLKFVGGRVLHKTPGEMAAQRAAVVDAADRRHVRNGHHGATIRAMLDAINEARVAVSLPALTAADIEAGFMDHLTTARGT